MFLKPFAGSDMKIERAYRHFYELEDRIASYQTEANPEYVPVPGEDMTWTFEMKAPPPELAVVLGDIAHSLRSALDIMLCDIARLRGKGQSDVSFPFAESESSWAEKLAKTNKDAPWKKLGADVVDEISRLQPYRGGNIYLRGLHDLNNMDKHKIVCPIATFMSTLVDHMKVWELKLLRQLEIEKRVVTGPIELKPNFGETLVGIVPGDVFRRRELSPYEEFPIDGGYMTVRLPLELPNSVPFAGHDISTLAQKLLDTTSGVVDLFRGRFG